MSKSNTSPDKRRRSRYKLRAAVLSSLKAQGFKVRKKGGYEILSPSTKKKVIRGLYKHARDAKLKSNIDFLKSDFAPLRRFFANGDQVDLNSFTPILAPVEGGTEDSRLFRLASLLWSVPVSQGFGRRKRFLVFDKANQKLVGLFALGDPVFNLKCRDELIGWDHHQRARKLYHVMDIFVLGSVPPYSNLLCGKLIAMIAACNEVRRFIFNKYVGKKSNILHESREPHLVFLTTASALGKSSLYNRIKYNGQLLYQRIGETQGWGHFHLANETFNLMRNYLEMQKHPIAFNNRFGHGPNWKMRLIRTCLQTLRLPSNLLCHGIHREVYGVALAENYRSFLRGEDKSISFFDHPMSGIVDFFKERWFYPRAKRIDSYRYVKSEQTLSALMKVASTRL